MERDPLRLAWKTNPGRHLLGFCLLTLAGLLLLVGLDLVRIVVNQATGAPGASEAANTFLRIVITPPESIWVHPIVLFPGFALPPQAFAIATIGGLLIVPLLIALTLTVLDWVVVSIGAGVLARIRTRILEAVVKAPSAQDDASDATALAGDELARESSILGAALLVPVQLGGMIGLAFAYVLVTDWRLGATLAVALTISAGLNARRLVLRFEAIRARHREGQDVDAAFGDLRHRVPAVRAHGTGAFEQDRTRQALVRSHRAVEAREKRVALADAIAAAALMIAPLSVLAVAVWFADVRPPTAGSVAASILAASLAAFGIREIVQWHRFESRARSLLADIGQSLGGLQPRDRRQAGGRLPQNGALVAEGVSAYDRASGARITAVTMTLGFPAHVALIGDGDAGPRVFAALVGGLIPPSTGRLTYGGVELASADPAERAQRIAVAGETVLIPGTLRDNLIYGSADAAGDIDARLSEAIAVTGLDRLTHARGLSGTLNPKREPEIAAAIVESRRAVQAALAREGLDRFVDPFHAERYNRYATIGENLLFGKPIGDTFREDRLSGHPFVRAILEADDLTKPLERIGLSIATSMIEIFAEIPDGHPLFERFSFFSAGDRTYFEDLVERRSEKRRGVQTSRDQERLIGLALRYNENQHRLGLLDDAMQDRILAARDDFTHMLPVSLKPSIEFYDENRFCAAASVQDNVLFGRIASDQAGAAQAVQASIRQVLTERGLDAEVSRIGLDTPIDIQGSDLTLSEIAAIDLVRCLVRRPSVLVVQRALDGLPGPAADRLVASLRRALVGRGLVLVTSEISPVMDQPPFDAVIRFERGEPVMDNRVRQPEALSA